MRREKRHHKKAKIIICLLAAVAVILAGAVMITGRVGMNSVDTSKISEIPSSYDLPLLRKGRLEYISYKTDIYGTSKKNVTKKAVVYIPYGYDKNTSKKYDILYLVHGYGGTEKTFLGTPSSPRKLKTILDHMIADKTIKPIIVVSPTFTVGGESQGNVFESFEREVHNDVLPAVESKYRTYAKNTTDTGIRASRSRRAFGGFSMGGSFTWLMLKDHTADYKYYMPMSCPLYYMGKSKTDYTAWMAKSIDTGVAASGYKKNQYLIFAASGTKDFTCNQISFQVDHLKTYTNEFTYTTKNFSSGNLMFHAFKGHYHRFSQSYVYIYNGLIKFFSYQR
jgi:predicted esterase